jgi:hypothetical protein
MRTPVNIQPRLCPRAQVAAPCPFPGGSSIQIIDCAGASLSMITSEAITAFKVGRGQHARRWEWRRAVRRRIDDNCPHRGPCPLQPYLSARPHFGHSSADYFTHLTRNPAHPTQPPPNPTPRCLPRWACTIRSASRAPSLSTHPPGSTCHGGRAGGRAGGRWRRGGGGGGGGGVAPGVSPPADSSFAPRRLAQARLQAAPH